LHVESIRWNSYGGMDRVPGADRCEGLGRTDSSFELIGLPLPDKKQESEHKEGAHAKE
jgi:hypothetical protein